MIKVNEIFKSIQGESTWAGEICGFIRLTGCNLHCLYCDTQYAFDQGDNYTLKQIVEKISALNTKIIEITGGEPLLQEETPSLVEMLIDKGYTVLIETNGSLPISPLPKESIKIVDIKCPDSGAHGSFLKENLKHLSKQDECKFVISTKNDFHWACKFVQNENLAKICKILFSPVEPNITLKELSQLILDSNVDVRLGFQLHKMIWEKNTRGV